MVFLSTTSSETVHMKAVEELRSLDFQTFESFVIERLAKELGMKQSTFHRGCFTIRYITEDASTKGYHYCLLSDDYEAKLNICTDCFGYWHRPSELRYTIKAGEVKIINYKFIRHLRSIQEFLCREENLKQAGIFLKQGTPEMIAKLRKEMQSTAMLDLDKLGCSVHDCANMLKQYLLQMSEPLFLSNYYPAYARIAQMAQSFEDEMALRDKYLSRIRHGRLPKPNSELLIKERKLVNCLQLIVQLMTHRKRQTFEHLIDILASVYRYRAFNSMTASALGAIFAPLIMCPRGLPRDVTFGVSRDMTKLVSKIIKIGPEIMGAPTKLRITVWRYVLHAKDRLDEERPSVAPIPYNF